jgi:hypothetical protein
MTITALRTPRVSVVVATYNVVIVVDGPAAHSFLSTDSLRWGDGCEIETVINTRIAQAGMVIREVKDVESQLLYGASNLHAVRDGLRVRIRTWQAA